MNCTNDFTLEADNGISQSQRTEPTIGGEICSTIFDKCNYAIESPVVGGQSPM